MNSILIGVITAVFAIGIHSSGKNIFKLAEGTTVFATAESIKNNLTQNLKDDLNSSAITDDENPYNSSSFFGDIDVSDSLDENESIISSSGNSVG